MGVGSKKNVKTKKTVPNHPSAPGPKKNYVHLVALSAILILTIIIYQPVLHNAFTFWDDDVYVTQNKLIQHPGKLLSFIKTPVGGNYHPLTMYSLALDWKISSRSVFKSPGGQDHGISAHTFHLTNLLLHLINTILVFGFIWLLSQKNIIISLFSALCFAIHPMHVESVAWVAERKDVLYTLFFLLALIAYLKYLEKKIIRWLFLCFICFILSLASKPAAVVLPILLLLLDLYISGKISKKMIIDKIPFLILSFVFGILTLRAQQAANASGMIHYNILDKILFASYGSILYLAKAVFPFNLSALYPYPVKSSGAWPIMYYLSPFLLALFLISVYKFSLNKKFIWFGIVFFFITIVLVLQFATIGYAIMADRYTYVPYIGLFFILGSWLDEYLQNKTQPYYSYRSIVFLVVGAFMLLYLMQTYRRCAIWKNDETLWTNAIDQYPGKLLPAYNNRGQYFRQQAKILLQANNKAGSIQLYKQAIADYDQVLSISPQYSTAWANKANVFLDMGKIDSAIVLYDKAIELQPTFWEPLINRGSAKVERSNFQGAIADFTEALNHDPFNDVALDNRAYCYSVTREYEKSIADYRKLSSILGNDHSISYSIAIQYQKLGQYQQSIAEFDKAISLSPTNGLYYLNRSVSWKALGNTTKANQDEEMARKLGAK